MNNFIARTIRRVPLAAAALASLVACGGGGDPEPVSSSTVDETPSAQALGAAMQKTAYKGGLAYAYHVSYDATGCNGVGIEIRAESGKTVTHGVPEKDNGIGVQVYTYNSCTEEGGFWSGVLIPADVKISKDLSSARATGTVLVGDFATVRTVAIDLKWSGGLLEAQPKTKIITLLPGQKTIVTQVSALRNSESVTGSLILDGVEMMGPAGSSGYVFSQAVIEKVRAR